MSAPRAVGSALMLVLMFAGCSTDDDAAGSVVSTARGVRWQTLPPMPSARSEVTVATDGQRIVVAGGFAASGVTVATVDVLDLSTTTWSRGPDLPIAINHPMAGLGGTIVVLGGYLGPGLEDPTDRAFALDERGWEEPPPMPTARHGLGVVSVGTVVYSIAGGTEPGLSVSDAVETIDLSPLRAGWIRARG